MNYRADQLVFVDESSCDRRTSYRGKAWAIQGQRAVRKAFFVRGKRQIQLSFLFQLKLIADPNRYSILPALSLDGILNVDVVEGSFNKTLFAQFVEGTLDRMNPFPESNSVIVMDNCQIHHADFILQMIVDRCVLTCLIIG